MDHELEGEELPPSEPKQHLGQTAKPKAVKQSQTNEKHVKPEPKPKVKFYDDEPWEEGESMEEEPSGSRDLPRGQTKPIDRSESPADQSSDDELIPARPEPAPAAPANNFDSSEDEVISDPEYEKAFKEYTPQILMMNTGAILLFLQAMIPT